MPLVLPGQEVTLNEPGRRFARHHHRDAYVALLVSGTCEEAGDCGRFLARPGDVLVHRSFEAHQDTIGRKGALFINLRVDGSLSSSFGRVDNLDTIVRAYERDTAEAVALLVEQFRPCESHHRDWPDLLARRLADPRPFRLDEWAESNGLHPASLSRGFKAAYSITPTRYRLEQAVSRAARTVRASQSTLSMIAAESGFADQAHMTRAMSNLFGVTPGTLRAFS